VGWSWWPRRRWELSAVLLVDEDGQSRSGRRSQRGVQVGTGLGLDAVLAGGVGLASSMRLWVRVWTPPYSRRRRSALDPEVARRVVEVLLLVGAGVVSESEIESQVKRLWIGDETLVRLGSLHGWVATGGAGVKPGRYFDFTLSRRSRMARRAFAAGADRGLR
jgi:hypothetical protein